MYYISSILQSLHGKIPSLANIRNLYVKERLEGVVHDEIAQQRVASIIDVEEAILVSFLSLV